MKIQGHKPILKGSRYVCADCGRFLLDITSPAKLRALTDVDQVKLGAVINRISSDPDLAERVATEDPREVVATYKLADKLNDFLMNPKARPDLQTPEAQQFLTALQRSYHFPKTDPMMPWLAREWKKGRIKLGGDNEPGVLHADFGPDYAHAHPDGGEQTFHRLMPSQLNHWADWYGSKHPSRQGKDIMQMKAPEMHRTIEDWDRDMREKAGEAAQVRGNVVHSYPDGWTVQQLTKPKELEDEGEAMGHCVGSYAGAVENGESLIYSLRDHHNEPHATWEVTPRWHEGNDGQLYGQPEPEVESVPSPKDGTVEQIQGKENKPPIPAYQKRIKSYFEEAMPNEEERPQWEDQHFDNVNDLVDEEGYHGYVAYHPGDYGLRVPKTTFDWPSLVEGQHGWGEYPAEDFVQKAVEHDQFNEMAAQAERDRQERRENRRNELGYEYEKYGEPEFAMQYHEHDPEPSADEPPYHEGDYNENGYNKAWEEWEQREMAARDAHMEEWLRERENSSYDWSEGENMDSLEAEIAAQKRREAQAATQPQQTTTTAALSTLRAPHQHFTTGEPCYCTFRQPEPAEWHQAAFATDDPSRCPTCGDPLEHGKCQRCDWGGWSNAMGPNDPIADPTKEMKPAIQS